MWSLCFSGSGACAGEHQAALACQPEMWIMYTAIKYPTVVSAQGEAELEQHLATLLLQGGMYTQGSTLTSLVDNGNLRAGGTNLAFGSSSCSHRGVTRGLSAAQARARLPRLCALIPIAFHLPSISVLAS